MERIEGNIRVVEKLFSQLREHNVEGVAELLADDVTWQAPKGLPNAGVHAGKRGIAEMLAALGEAYPQGITFHDLTLHSEGDRVFAEYRWEARTARGGHVKDHALTVFQLAFGKVTSVRQFTMRAYE